MFFFSYRYTSSKLSAIYSLMRIECSNGYYSENVEETPEDVLMELIARFGQTIMRAREDLEKYVQS